MKIEIEQGESVFITMKGSDGEFKITVRAYSLDC